MFCRTLFISAALVLFSLLLREGMEQYRQDNQVSVILLTVESLRQDLVRPRTTPHLLEAARSGYTSPHHRAVSGWTGTNMISLLTGLSPFRSGVHTRGQSVNKDLLLPLEILSERGYLVAGLQGFMTMDIYQNLGLTTDDVGSEPLFWLAKRGITGESFFLWEHYLHTHLPYTPGHGYEVDLSSMMESEKALERVRTVARKTNIPAGSVDFQKEDIQAIRALHEANVREFDDWFQEFWDFFNRSGLRSKTILIVTADHGDEHGERGNVGHASTNGGGQLHEEIVRVPLFIWLPEKLKRQEFPTEISRSCHQDVIVTLLRLLDITVPEFLQGRDLFDSEPPSSHYAMTSGGGFNERDPHNIGYFEYSLLEDDWKLLWRVEADGGEELSLFNLSEDPREEKILNRRYPDVFSRMKARLKEKIQQAEPRSIHPAQIGTAPAESSGPGWVYPLPRPDYSYDDFDGNFYLEWQGDKSADYILQYRAGKGENRLEGQLEVHGVKKDFGTLSRRYWQTWVVPASPIEVRVRRVNEGGWSDWLIVEARP